MFLKSSPFKATNFEASRRLSTYISCISLTLLLSYFIMKASTILSLLGLLSTSIAAPSHSGKKDVNIFLHEPASDHVETSIVPRLWPGYYIISSPALDRDFVIGRGLFEDHSLKPKEVKTVSRWDDRGQSKVIHFVHYFAHLKN